MNINMSMVELALNLLCAEDLQYPDPSFNYGK